jgi:hypothetical protein
VRRKRSVVFGRFVTVPELAAIAGHEPYVVRQDIREGRLPACRVGEREYRIHPRRAVQYLIGARGERPLSEYGKFFQRSQRIETTVYRDSPVGVASIVRVLNLSDQGVRNVIRSGALPARKLGRDWLVHGALFIRFVESLKCTACGLETVECECPCPACHGVYCVCLDGQKTKFKSRR